MKKAILSGLLAISTFCFAAPPNKAFFCTSPGTALYYERHEEGSGELAWKHTSSIVSSKDIQDGTFAGKWIAENKNGRAHFNAMRSLKAEHQLEKVGKEIRKMYSWSQKDNKYAD